MSQKNENIPPHSNLGAGLKNLGNSCYINSVLQSLAFLPVFLVFCKQFQSKYICHGDEKFCPLREGFGIMKSIISNTAANHVTPATFVKNIRILMAPRGKRRNQQDAQEFLTKYLDAIQQCEYIAKQNSNGCIDCSDIANIFGLNIKSTIKCCEVDCTNERENFDFASSLTISLESAHVCAFILH